MAFRVLISALLAAAALATPIEKRQAGKNDFSCKSTAHPNPVVLFHGLGATYYEDLNELEVYLQGEGFCTFSITYGAQGLLQPPFTGQYVGGLKPINESAAQLGTFVKKVQSMTGAAKVDLVGHSEGAFQTLYVTKFEGVSSFIGKVFAIAPPTHGTSFGNLYTIAETFGNLTIGITALLLNSFGCQACADLVTGGPAVVKLNQGPIAQSGVQYTILASTKDELVTPHNPETAFVNEAGVNNIYVQQYCPNDPVGHIGEAYDTNVWQLVLSTLNGNTQGPTTCVEGAPGR